MKHVKLFEDFQEDALNEEHLNSLKDLKARSPEAHNSLIDFWAELSRGSNSSAQRNLSKGIGDRFKIVVDGDKMEFEDTHAGLKYKWNGKRWI